MKFLSFTFILSFLIFQLRGQTISSKDLNGYWKYQTYDKSFRFFHFFDCNKAYIYIDSLTKPLMQGTYSIKVVQGETILYVNLNYFPSKPKTLVYLIHRLSSDSYVLKVGIDSGSDKFFKWKDISEQFTYPMNRVAIKKTNTTVI
jgi:hypothetical protein